MTFRGRKYSRTPLLSKMAATRAADIPHAGSPGGYGPRPDHFVPGMERTLTGLTLRIGVLENDAALLRTENANLRFDMNALRLVSFLTNNIRIRIMNFSQFPR